MSAKTTQRVHITLSQRQIRVLDKLCDKLLLERSEVIRVALARLAEIEGVKLGT